MNRIIRRTVALILVGAALAALPACGKREEFRDEVRQAIRRTQVLSGLLVYNDRRTDSSVTVRGIFADDFRYKARVSYGTEDAYDQVVSDDTLAVRFLNPAAMTKVVDQQRLASAKLDTDFENVTVVDALRTKRWVVDTGAAPYLSVGQIDEKKLGIDPVFDALTALDYIDGAVRKSLTVEKYDPDDLSPAYNRSEDTFPKPSAGTGIVRYDLRRPDLPPPSAGAVSGRSEAALPRTEHFRKMAIYIKDGKVFQVREAIEVRGKMIEDFSKYMRLFLREIKAPEKARNDFDKGLASTPPAQRGEALIFGLNIALAQFGEEPILTREMNLEFKNLGQDVDVALPTDAVVKGGLNFLQLSAAAKLPSAAGATPVGGAGGAGGATGPSPEGGTVEGDPAAGEPTGDTGGGDGVPPDGSDGIAPANP